MVRSDSVTAATVWHSMRTLCHEMLHVIDRTARDYLIAQLRNVSECTRLFTITTLWLLFLWSSAPAQEPKSELVRVGVSSWVSTSYVPLHIAKKLGFYAAEGLNVEIVLVPGLLGQQALVGGSLDFASATNPNAAIRGAKLKILMVFNDKPAMIFVAQPGIEKVEQLRGKTIAVDSIGGLAHGFLSEILPKFGLDPKKDVIFVVVGSTPDRFRAIKAGPIAATLLSAPTSLLAEDQGFSVLARVADHVEDIQASIVTTDEKLLHQESLVLRFLKATVKGQRVYLSSRDQADALIMELSRSKDRALALRAYDAHLATVAHDGTISERLQRIVIERGKRNVGVTREIRPEEIFDFSVLRRAHAEVDRSGWKP